MKRTVTLILGIFLILSFTACSNEDASSSEPACEHVLSRVERCQPTCTREGNRAHYECEICHRLFFDEKGKTELSVETVTIGKLPHSLSHYEATEHVPEYWHCFACDTYFTDEGATQETTYRALYENAYDPIRLSDITSGNVYLSTSAGGTMDPLSGDFTYRAFMSWTKAGDTLASFPDGKRVQVNLNLNDETTLPGSAVPAQWYNCGLGYSREYGLFYKNFSADDKVPVSQELTQTFLKQNGIYAIVVREGASVSFYLEDSEGNPHRLSSGSFDRSRIVVRLAVNIAEGADDWVPSSTNAAICIGIGDPKCVFDKVLGDVA